MSHIGQKSFNGISSGVFPADMWTVMYSNVIAVKARRATQRQETIPRKFCELQKVMDLDSFQTKYYNTTLMIRRNIP